MSCWSVTKENFLITLSSLQAERAFFKNVQQDKVELWASLSKYTHKVDYSNINSGGKSGQFGGRTLFLLHLTFGCMYSQHQSQSFCHSDQKISSKTSKDNLFLGLFACQTPLSLIEGHRLVGNIFASKPPASAFLIGHKSSVL